MLEMDPRNKGPKVRENLSDLYQDSSCYIIFQKIISIYFYFASFENTSMFYSGLYLKGGTSGIPDYNDAYSQLSIPQNFSHTFHSISSELLKLYNTDCSLYILPHNSRFKIKKFCSLLIFFKFK